MGPSQTEKDRTLELVDVVDTGRAESGTRDVRVSVVKLMIVDKESAQVEHETIFVALSTTVTVVLELNSGAVVDIGMRDIRVSVVKLTIVLDELAQ